MRTGDLVAEDIHTGWRDNEPERGLLAGIIRQAFVDLTIEVRPTRADGAPFKQNENK